MTSNISATFDYKDIKIIRAIDEQTEANPSSTEISKIVNIPARSIRYRLAKLKEQQLLQEKTVITHERKLGIRENFMIVQENPKYLSKFQTIINENPALSWGIPTSGKYNGYLVHAINAMNVPNYPLLLLQKMKKRELIRDFSIFELVDSHLLGWNYQYFNKKGNWIWEW
ncbi:MAG: winged helix-turn-helix transcriptional regulator, partial [Candidatus Heimdallarchaeota archaeon]|nr:winged helix-turn-helix transcriptional regulator [Candidatus Heimdallarchaeota archaeon]